MLSKQWDGPKIYIGYLAFNPFFPGEKVILKYHFKIILVNIATMH